MNTKKCIVLDLDNTLWGGVVGEDGFDGIKLSPSKDGAGFVAFQQVLLDLHNRGIILAINSKNNFDDAIEIIRSHPNMILKEHNFAAMQINWGDKSENLIEISKELNIGLDSMIFFDDDPTNRALVRNVLPEVEVPELPMNATDYAKFLMDSPYFTEVVITDEDKMRGNFYVTERLRKEAEKSFENRESFLKSLGLELQVFIDDTSAVARLSQLTGKTNQFNANKRFLMEEDIIKLINDPKYKIFYGRVTDRFGDHGITNFAVVENKDSVWNIEHLLMSCRVVGRGIEEAFLSFIGKVASLSQAQKLSIDFTKTEKNILAEEFVKNNFKGRTVSINKIKSPPKWVKIKHGKI
ncbi:MAG: HAD-IIIC family phosphatase [bacterium]|nr:HAD-IIIC family phosphatase [bacterium]